MLRKELREGAMRNNCEVESIKATLFNSNLNNQCVKSSQQFIQINTHTNKVEFTYVDRFLNHNSGGFINALMVRVGQIAEIFCLPQHLYLERYCRYVADVQMSK